MIAFIKGKLIAKGENYIVLENSGIGYRIFTTPKVFEMPLKSELELHTYMQVREDAQALFGFLSPADLQFFELLITVSGVGPKVALSILSADNTDLVKQAIAAQDAAVFTRIGGVGKKTAEKIIVELKEKIVVIQDNGMSFAKGGDDIIIALENLGYSGREIKEVILKLDHSLSTEEKLRQALKILSR
jgi:Holliday junction DNA helicase RuvA